ncbi:MAG: myo-inosose-2 dehydratase [Ostreibacterium sp.]
MSLDVRIGINPIGWSNDDLPSLGGETPLEVALSEGERIGYQGFELGNKFPKTGKALKAKLDEYNLVCVSGWYSANLARLDKWSVADEINACRQHMEKLAYNDCKVVVYGEVGNSVQSEINTPVSQRPQFANQDRWQCYADNVSEFGRHLINEYGIQIAYHHHMGAYVESPSDIDQFMALTDKETVGMLFDTGHSWFGQATNNPEQSIDVTDVLKKHIDRVNHVHCKDVLPYVIRDMRNRNQSFLQSVLTGAFTVPGDGAIDFSAVLKVLNDHNYSGWLVVEAEQDPKLAPSYEYGKKGFETLKKLMEKTQ